MSTGPNGGIGAGERGPGRPEGVKFNQKSTIKANELGPEGTIVGTLPFDGEAPTGESLLKIRQIMTSAQSSAKKVERQAIPAEHRDTVRRFQESLHRGVTEPAGGASPEKTGEKQPAEQ